MDHLTLPGILFEALAHHPDVLVVVTDATGQVEWVNATFCDRTQTPQAAFVGASFDSVLQSISCSVGDRTEMAQVFPQGQSLKRSLVSCDRQGNLIRWQINVQPIGLTDGIPAHYVIWMTDNTTQHQTATDLAQTQQRLTQLVEQAHLIPWEADLETHQFTYVGPQVVQWFGYDLERWYEPNFWQTHIHADDLSQVMYHNQRSHIQPGDYTAEYRFRARDDLWVWVRDLVTVVRQEDGSARLIGFWVDVSDRKQIEIALRAAKSALESANHDLERRVERRTAALRLEKEKTEQALEHLKAAQMRLIQSEKLSGLGQMVAGIAHEISNPLSCIVGNLEPAEAYISDLFELIHTYRHHFPDGGETVDALMKEIDLEFLVCDLPKLFGAMQEAAERIATITRSMRTFTRSNPLKKVQFNIHEGIDSTLVILHHRLRANEQRPEIEVIRDYGDLPLIWCYPGRLNQVLMNLLVNAIDALEESNQSRAYQDIKTHPNQIYISTQAMADQIRIRIRDNGPGIPVEIQARIFDYLFTTKSLHQGTGLGLAISRQIIEENHGGKLSFQSFPGEGTEFVIELPVGIRPDEELTIES